MLVMVYILPTTRIKRNVAATSYSFNWEGVYPELAQGYSSSILDNDTDVVMFATAAASVDNPITDAMLGTGEFAATQEVERGRVGAMLDYVNEVQVQYVKVPYARYWHG